MGTEPNDSSIATLLGGLIYNWNFHVAYRSGLKIDEGKPLTEQEGFFNYHVFLMMFFYFLPNAIAAGIFRFATFIPREWAKMIHITLNTIGLCASWAAFGMLTLVIYTIQWVLGVLFYALSIIPLNHKINFMPIHRAIGALSYVLVAMSVVVGLFSNYAYDIKYMNSSSPDYDEDKADKLNRFNWMILLLTLGTSITFYYIINAALARPKPVEAQNLPK